MTDSLRRAMIYDWMMILDKAADYLESQNYNIEAQEYVSSKDYINGGMMIELESPENGKTEASWVRLQYGDCFLFMYRNDRFKKRREYQFDPYCEYGAEVIVADTIEQFTEALQNLTDIEKKYYAT